MKLYRLIKADFRNISGDRKAGRWHNSTVAALAALRHPGMCLIESGIVTEISKIPKGYFIQELDVPDGSILYVTEVLPEHWDKRPFRPDVQEFGATILKEAEYLVIAFPSAVMAKEFVYYINPLHPDFHRVKETDFYDFKVDSVKSGVQ